jgi:hypothetical protein
LPVKLRRVRLVELLLFELRRLVQIFRLVTAPCEQRHKTARKKQSDGGSGLA